MEKFIKYQSEIPSAPWYVTMNDAFLSGWGGAQNKIASYIYPCDSIEEARAVAGNARARTDQRRVAVVSGQSAAGFPQRPKLVRGHTYQVVTKDMAPRWYEPGAFAAQAKARRAEGGKRKHSASPIRLHRDPMKPRGWNVVFSLGQAAAERKRKKQPSVSKEIAELNALLRK